MSIDLELLSQHLDDIHAVKESIKLEFTMTGNPGLPAIFLKLQDAQRALEDTENMLNKLVKG